MRHWLLAVILSAAITVTLSSQQDQGFIAGTVTDTTGAVIPGTKVTVRDVNTNISHDTTTNSGGFYSVGPIKIGVYEVSATVEGFKRSIREGVELHASDRIGIDFQLQVGNVVETVAVTGTTPMLQTEQSDISHVVERVDIEQLPLNSRNYQALALMTAGVVPEIGGRDLGPTMEGGHSKSGFVSHGQPALQNNYVLDGVDNNSNVMGQQDRKSQSVIPSLDAVQEFKVQTSNYTAEFGNNAGAVVNVTIKSGTNDFHGSAYDFLRNDIFDARPTFSYIDRTGDGKADPNVLRQNQFGATIGGPISRNRTFFFGSYEGWRIRSVGSAQVTVPSLLERQGDFSATARISSLKDPLGGTFPNRLIPKARFDPVMIELLEFYPNPNFSDPLTRVNYVVSPPHSIDRNQYDGRVDHRFSDKDVIFARYSYYDFANLDEGPIPGVASAGAVHDNFGRHLSISETHVFSPSLVNEFRFGYKYVKPNRRTPTDVPLTEANAAVGITGVELPSEVDFWGMSRIQFTGGLGFQQLGGNFNQPNVKDIRTIQLIENLNWTNGNHNLKFGADLRYDMSNIYGGKNARGGFTFDGRYSGISLADGILGWAYQVHSSRLDLARYFFQSYMFYVQDDWKVTKDLTLNLGLRYELRTPWMEASGRYNTIDFRINSPNFGVVTTADKDGTIEERSLSRFYKDGFAPRLGFAWRFQPGWTFRGGAGMFYGGQMGLGADSRPSANFPYASVVTAQGTNQVAAGFLRDGIPTGFLGELVTVQSVNDFPKNASLQIWSYDYRPPLTSQWNATIQRQIRENLSLEVAYVGSATQNISSTYNANDTGPGDPKTINARRIFPRLNSITYRSPFAHASYHGMDLNFRKRMSDGFTFTFGYTWSHSIGQVAEQFVGGDSPSVQDTACFSCDRGNSSNDVRQRGVFSYIYELPIGKGRRFLNRRGFADTVFGGWQLTGMLVKQTGQYFHVTWANKSSFLGTNQGEWRANIVGAWEIADRGPDKWFDPAAFAKPCSPNDSTWSNCSQGNLGRNSMQEPGIFNWDFGVGKTWSLTERFRLQYRAEAFNLSNTPSYGTPGRNLDSGSAGVIRSTNSTERQIQMGIRLTW